LDQEIPAIRLIASKQLYFFVPFQGQPDATGKPVEVLHEFSRALRDANPDVQWQALVQLRELRLQDSRDILREFAEDTSDEQLREVANATLASLTA
jgi:hypothetical protein